MSINTTRLLAPYPTPPSRTVSTREPLKVSMAKHSEFMHGTCQQLLFSPKGGIEGALVKMKGALVQVAVAELGCQSRARLYAPTY